MQTGASSDRNGHISGRDKLIALCFAIIVIVLGHGLIVKGVTGVTHDDGIYLITAKAIAQGEGYRQIHLPDAPVQTKYPFLYPAILAVIWRLFPSFPANLLLMQWISLLLGAASGGATYLYLVRFGYVSRGVAAAAVSLCVTSAQFLFFCTTCLTEMPFALLLIAALWILDRHSEMDTGSRTTQFLIGIVVALPLFCRMIGVVSPVMLLFLALLGKRNLRWALVGSAVVAVPFLSGVLIFSQWAGAAASSSQYYTNYISWWNDYGIPFLGRVLSINGFNVLYGSTPVSLIRWLSMPSWISWGAAAIGLFGLMRLVRQVRLLKTLPVFLVLYLAIVLMWPWPPLRFLIPVMPFLFAYSITALVDGLKKSNLRHASCAFLAALLFLNLKTLTGDIENSKKNRYPARMQEFETSTVHWSSYQDMFQWIKERTDPGDVFISGMDPTLYLYTGRKAARPFVARPATMFYEDSAPALGSMDEILENISFYKPEYLVLTPMPGFAEDTAYGQFVVEAQRKYPGWLERVYLGKDKRFVIWKINYYPSVT